jgi:putative Mg2+ transporter-C (MgtC) family protein
MPWSRWGAALFVSMSHLVAGQGDPAHVDPTRIISYIVSGLGFLGGGVILRDGLNVKGMNTAATIWCTGAIGSLAGMGFLIEAGVGAALVLGVHITMRPVVLWFEAHKYTAVNVETYYRIRVRTRSDQEAVIRSILLRHIGSESKMGLQSLATDEAQKDAPTVVAEVYSSHRNDQFMEQLVARLSIEPNVTAISWERIHV